MLEKLIEYFLKFPGIGPRQAKRFVYFLAGKDEEFLKEFSGLIFEIRKKIRQCGDCGRFFQGEEKICNVCSDSRRDSSLLLIVEKDVDLENMERAGFYNGRYFVLGGLLPLAGDKKNGLRFAELFERAKVAAPKEIILALSANAEGENTERYIKKILEPIRDAQGKPIKISTFGRGFSTGTEVEYSDSETLKNALDNRK